MALLHPSGRRTAAGRRGLRRGRTCRQHRGGDGHQDRGTGDECARARSETGHVVFPPERSCIPRPRTRRQWRRAIRLHGTTGSAEPSTVALGVGGEGLDHDAGEVVPGIAAAPALKPHTRSTPPVPAAAICAILTGAVGSAYQASVSAAEQVPEMSSVQSPRPRCRRRPAGRRRTWWCCRPSHRRCSRPPCSEGRCGGSSRPCHRSR